jgi:hypothetical protein
MLWWLIILSVLVVYLLFKVYQILKYLKLLRELLIKQFVACGCPADPSWPPPEPPPFP